MAQANLAQVRAKLEKAATLCEEAIALMRKADPSAPADHVRYHDDFLACPRQVRRGISFVISRGMR